MGIKLWQSKDEKLAIFCTHMVDLCRAGNIYHVQVACGNLSFLPTSKEKDYPPNNPYSPQITSRLAIKNIKNTRKADAAVWDSHSKLS